MNNYHSHFLPFDLEDDRFQPVSNINDADIIPLLISSNAIEIQNKIKHIQKLGFKKQKILVLDIFHIDDDIDYIAWYNSVIENIKELIDADVGIVHTNMADKNNIYYDFLWNREKAYFTDYNRYDLSDRVWTWSANIQMFGLRKILRDGGHMRKFLCPNRVYYTENNNIQNHTRFKYRDSLKTSIQEKDGYYSDPGQGIVLEPEQKEVLKEMLHGQGGTWYPVSNNLYNSSYYSVYVETITATSEKRNRYRSITEKTWDPLIKGHFVLPFSYQGIIEDIKSYGFEMPKWIDYSYCDIYDDKERFEKFLKTFDDLYQLSFNDLNQLFAQDKDILENNRRLFWTRPYDSLYDKLVNYFKL
jgi:hypothetical protein